MGSRTLSYALSNPKPVGWPMARAARVICLHSTETGGLPGYGGSAPHLTVDPRTMRTWQHAPFDVAAGALKNLPGGVHTNTDGVIQVEIVGTCDAAFARRYGYTYLPDLDEKGLAYLGAVLRDLSAATGVPLVTSVPWRSYPASYGQGASQRLSFAAWGAYRGVLGHQHVPENDHGDPGDLDVPRILQYANDHGVPSLDELETFMASINDKTIASPIPGDKGKPVSVVELLMSSAADSRRSREVLDGLDRDLRGHLAAGGPLVQSVAAAVRGAK